MPHMIHFAAPPMLARRLRSDIETAFPDFRLSPPSTHLEMFEAAVGYGSGTTDAMTITAYPQLLNRVIEEGAPVAPLDGLDLPPLRPELAASGLTPPGADIVVVAAVPLVPAVDRNRLPNFREWDDLRALIEGGAGMAGAPPDDTPLPYLLSSFLAARWGVPEKAVWDRLDQESPPLEINKRLAAGDLAAGLLPPAFCRNAREGRVELVWPSDGALIAPVIAVLSPDAPSETREVLRALLSSETQRVFAELGGMIPVVDGVPGSVELEAANWSLRPVDWTGLLDIGRAMTRRLTMRNKNGESTKCPAPAV